MNQSCDVVVLGAGMVGISAALALRRRGLDVILLDRREPGHETSYGNSGVLSRSSVLPINNPSLIGKLPGYLLNRHPALSIRYADALRRPSWAARFLFECTAAGTRQRSDALDRLIVASLALHRQWMPEAGVDHRLRETGWLKAWRSVDGRAAAEAEQQLCRRYGIRADILDSAGIAALEPGLKPVYRAGLIVRDSASVDNPAAVVAAYAGLFVRHNGRIVQGEARGVTKDGEGWRIDTDTVPIAARDVVVALGPWAADLLRPLGLRVPLAFERGYHLHFTPATTAVLSRPVHDIDCAFVMAPMQQGIRVTTGVELADRDSPPDYRQMNLARTNAAAAFPLGAPVEREPWRGARPTLPDSLPMIGAIPGRRGLYAAFGHQHIGLSTGPATGEAIAALIAGAPPPFDLSAFSPARYLRA